MARVTALGTVCHDGRYPGREFYFCEPGVAPAADPRFDDVPAASSKRCNVCGSNATQGLWFSKGAGDGPITICVECGPDPYPHRVTYTVPRAGPMTARYRALGVPRNGVSLPEFTAIARGPTWKWGDQDGSAGAVGWLTSTFDPASKWCATQWHAAGANNYRMQLPALADVVPVLLHPGFAVADAVPCPKGPVPPPSRAAGGAVAPAPGDYPHSITYRSPDGTRHTVRYRHRHYAVDSDLPAGTVVVRGPSWTWKNQDGTAGAPGWLAEPRPGGGDWARVTWHANGTSNGYRLTERHTDLIPIDVMPGPAAAALLTASRGTALVDAGDAAAVPEAVGAAPPGPHGPSPAEEAVAILRAEKGSLEDEIRRLMRSRRDVEAERDAATGQCAGLRRRVAELEAAVAEGDRRREAAVEDRERAARHPRLGECLVCYDQAATVALIPCGHACYCPEDVEGVHECPICRTAVTGTLRVYPSGVQED